MRIFTTIFAGSLVFAGLLCGQQVTVQVLDAPTVTMSAADLAALPRHTAILHDHGKEIPYEGVLVHDVLTKAGLDFGKELHSKQLSSYVEASAADGYKVVYALAEFDPTVMDSDILIADKEDGHGLSEKAGPLRIIVPHDKRPTRSVRMLTKIAVVQVRK